MEVIAHHAVSQNINPTKSRLLTQQFQKPPLRFIIKEKLSTRRPTRHMIHPLLTMHQVPTPKPPSSQILHHKNLRKAEPKASLLSINTLCNLKKGI
jgi:hypothetical protein